MSPRDTSAVGTEKLVLLFACALCMCTIAWRSRGGCWQWEHVLKKGEMMQRSSAGRRVLQLPSFPSNLIYSHLAAVILYLLHPQHICLLGICLRQLGLAEKSMGQTNGLGFSSSSFPSPAGRHQAWIHLPSFACLCIPARQLRGISICRVSALPRQGACIRLEELPEPISLSLDCRQSPRCSAPRCRRPSSEHLKLGETTTTLHISHIH